MELSTLLSKMLVFVVLMLIGYLLTHGGSADPQKESIAAHVVKGLVKGKC